jgi:hypothetical protein
MKTRIGMTFKTLSLVAILAASAAHAKNYDFDLVVVQAVSGSPGPVPLVFEGTFTDKAGVISNVNISTLGGLNPWPVTLNAYLDGAFVDSFPTNQASDFFLAVTTARPLGGGRPDPITAAGIVFPGSGAAEIGSGGSTVQPYISCGGTSGNIAGVSCFGSITRVRASEIDASSAVAGLTLLLGSLMVLRGRRPSRPVA